MDESLAHIVPRNVDVNVNCKESALKCETASDSGLDINDTCPNAFFESSNYGVPPIEDLEHTVSHGSNSHGDVVDDGASSVLSSPTSISLDGNLRSSDELLSDQTVASCVGSNQEPSNPEHKPNLKNFTKVVLLENSPDENVASSANNTPKESNGKLNNDITINIDNVRKIISEEIETPKNLTTSSTSLNESSVANKTILCKSPYSRSAEDISLIDEKQSEQVIRSSTSDLNAEKILTEYTNKKNKANAMQKIVSDNIQTNTDMKYAILPKELLSQDLGSIVKNVHGIFSSVSGSLKNAYSNTHRITSQKHFANHTKPIPNGKVMNDIFEDDNIEAKEIKSKPLNLNGMDNVASDINKNADVLKVHVNGEEDDIKNDVLRLQIESLERLLAELRKENMNLKERMKQQTDELLQKDQTFKELEGKMDLMSKRVEQAQREKNAAVMRYASVECASIEARRATEKAAASERAAKAEMELLNNKLKSAHNEKQRICQLYDDKCHELGNSERETSKLREEIRELEGRLKWTQSKLRVEMDAYKESTDKVEKLTQQVTELEANKEAAVAQSSDTHKSKQLESELKECQAALILCRHERDELERRVSSVTQRADDAERDRDEAKIALAKATAEVDRLRIKNAELEQEAAELAALRAQASLADTLSAQLNRESERASEAEAALSRERARAETCLRREAAALEHAARLTAQHVAATHDATHHQGKAQALSADNAALRERAATAERERDELRDALLAETERRARDSRALARKVAELTDELSETNKRLEWEKGENGVLKKKHASAVKEVNRELQRTLRRCQLLEEKAAGANSIAGSVSSLSSGEGGASHEDTNHEHADAIPDIQCRSPPQQALVERIVSLQRAAARRSERVAFLEEHCRQLTVSLRDRGRLLRHLLAAGQNTAAGEHTKELARIGGGSLSGCEDDLPADVARDVARRLQAVLEDTLLKNITLKENLDTLGQEVARLKQSNTTDLK